MSTDRPRLKVLSMAGAGRSGTTVLASILGEVDGILSAGELRWLWERGVIAGRPCGCGSPPVDCPVWGPVIERAAQRLGGRDAQETVRRIVAAQRDVGRSKNLPRVLASAGAESSDWPALRLVQEPRVRLLTYPRGRHNHAVRAAASRAGYSHAFRLPESREIGGPFSIRRTGVYRGNGLTHLRLKSARPYLRTRTGGACQLAQLAVRSPRKASSWWT